EMARRQAELDRAEREQREREEAAAREVREREAAAAREQQQREREDFLVKGPGLDALVDVIGAHYNVESATVLYWLSLYDVQLPVTTAPQEA
ncbi:hypothetical protein M4D56_26410, partial [Cytobacillus oceanisediminis]|uniref:hypothetical protein n=2 Tax=Bacteria TaxID=2 RepID=UPI00203EAF77